MTSEADADVGQPTAGLLGLPDAVTAGLFDLGVPTNTAAVHDKAVHDKAWSEADALGLGGAVLVGTGRTAAFLWLAVGLLVATLTQVRNAFGMVSVLATGAVVGAVAWWGEPALQAGFAAALVWFLLFGGLRSVRELQRGRRRIPGRFGGESDADALARLTGVPGGMWSALFWLLATVAMITGAWVLVGRIA